MECIVNQKKINIPIDEKPFGEGSEGKVYKINEEIYKIYHQGAFNEGYGNKQNFHSYLIGIDTKQIILPDALIWDLESKYLGYKTKLVKGKQKDKTGIIKIPSEQFIKNLQILENDIKVLSEKHVLMADTSPINYIFNNEDNTMNIIDPGRYRISKSFKSDCLLSNEEQYKELIEILLYLDFIKFKPVGPKRKELSLKQYLKEQLRDSNLKYSEFFENVLQKHDDVESYAKSLRKYIK